MVSDIYDEARTLRNALQAQGHAEWASRLEDVLSGSTGTEILMGLRWLTSELRRHQLGDESMKQLAERIYTATDALLR